MDKSPSVRELFKNKTIFLTGATGFLGKMVVEKLLATCDIATMYILIREKKGQSVEQRCKSFFNDQLFKFRTDVNKLTAKVKPIAGDISMKDLGISPADRKKIIDEVDIIIHSAASVKFDEPLSVAMAMNVESSLSVLNLAKETVNLKFLVYVGTAFSSCYTERFEETVSRPACDPMEILALMKEQDEETFNGATFARIRGDHPNSYTLTKQMSEAMVNDFAIANGIRTLIAKPGIILPPMREPCAFYVESVSQASQSVAANLGVGFMTVLPGKVTNAFAGIPADTCANCLLVSCADADQKWLSDPSDKVKVYGLYNTSDNIITNTKPFRTISLSAQKYPTLRAVRPINPCTMTTSPYLYTLQVWLFEFVFAFFFDLFLMVSGKPAKIMRAVKKSYRMMGVLGYFISIDWKVSGQNVAAAFARLSDEEKQLYDCDLSHVDWEEYFEKFWLGIRKWIFREELDNLREARTRLKRLQLTYYSAGILIAIMASVILFSIGKFSLMAISAVRHQILI